MFERKWKYLKENENIWKKMRIFKIVDEFFLINEKHVFEILDEISSASL